MAKARDLELIDRLESYGGRDFSGDVWRVTFEQRDPVQCHESNGRWDTGTFPVLYTSLSESGAIAERRFHLNQQPVFPSKLGFTISQIQVSRQRLLNLTHDQLFGELGVEETGFSSQNYRRCQEIGDVARFLSYQGIRIPSARFTGDNIVLFCDELSPHEFELVKSEPIDLRN